MGTDSSLLERDAELTQFDAALDGTDEARPIVIEGPAGIGKTRLLSALRERARARSLEVLYARGGELERDYPFGVVRQLFGPLLHGAADPERRRLLAGAAAQVADLVEGGELAPGEDPGADPSHAIMHGLDRLLANLAARGPVLVAVDDAHWGDPPSLRWLGYTARRGAESGVLLAISLRPSEDEAARLLEPVVWDPAARRLEPGPLSAAAGAQIVAGAFPAAEAAFAGACHRATAGNPFYLSELLRAMAADHRAPTTANVDRVLEMGPAAVARATLGRFRTLPAAALPLARAVAVLGTDVALRHAAAVAGVDEREASLAAEALAKAEILRDEWPLEFVHPIVRAAIRSDLSAAATARLHAAAARVLEEDRADPDRVAAHVLAAQPAGDPWAAEVLRRAAERATARGAPDAAARYLARAVAEPVTAADRRDTLRALGLAEAHSGGDATAHLQAALDLTADPAERADLASELAGCLLMTGRAAEAVACLDEAIAALPEAERELGLRLESDLHVAAWGSLAAQGLAAARRPRFEADLARLATRGDRLAAGGRAMLTVVHDNDARAGGELALRVLGAGLLDEVGSHSPALYLAMSGVLHAGAITEAERELNVALAHAQRHGSIRGYAMVTAWRAVARYRRGLLAEAEADARESNAARLQIGMVLGLPMALAYLAHSLIDQGRLEEAETELAPWLALTESDFVLADYLRHAAARLRLAQGRAEEGLELLYAIGRFQAAWGIVPPCLAPWRSTAAGALARLGREAEARELAAEEVEIARGFGSAPALGIALRTAGTLAGRGELELLRESVDVLAGSGAELEHARSLTELGAALRRAGLRREARQPLREALDVAHRRGAALLAARAREELVAAGAKPRRDALRGRDALTASEARVARLAAEGRTNREIAAELVVTPKTVEVHLGSVYRKLEIASRTELPAALAGAERGAGPAAGGQNSARPSSGVDALA
jgi:DNA-binding CsgD family transcriptional regulator